MVLGPAPLTSVLYYLSQDEVFLAGSFIFLLAWCVCCYRDFYKYAPPLFLVLLQSWLKEEITWFLTSVSVMETLYAAFSVCLFLFFKTWFQILKKSSIAVDLVTWHNLLSLYIDFTNWTHDVSLNHKIEDSCVGVTEVIRLIAPVHLIT